MYRYFFTATYDIHATNFDQFLSGLSAVTGQMQDARNEAEDGDDTDVGGSSVFFNRDV